MKASNEKKHLYIVIWIMAIIIIVLALYVGFDLIKRYENKKLDALAYNMLHEFANNILSSTENCGIYRIKIGNRTRALIDVNCANKYYSLGYVAAVKQIILNTNNCQIVPVYYGNITRNIMDYDCLARAIAHARNESGSR